MQQFTIELNESSSNLVYDISVTTLNGPYTRTTSLGRFEFSFE